VSASLSQNVLGVSQNGKEWDQPHTAYPRDQLRAEDASALEKATSVVHKEDTQEKFYQHKWWDHGKGWKNTLNNLRLMTQN
jgi:hypothetical protein